MSRRARIEREVKVFVENCIAREELNEPGMISYSCAHAPGGNMIWGDPPEVFCKECIHYQRGHVPQEEEVVE